MTENVLIALIVVGGVVILGVVYLLRDHFGFGSFSASKKGVSASVKAHEEKTSSVSGNEVKGDGHILSAENGGKVDENKVEGKDIRLEGK